MFTMDVSVMSDLRIVRRKVERVGVAYSNLKTKHNTQKRVLNTTGDAKNTKVDIEYLRSLDPKEWRSQDHYAVLGLKDVRFNATDEDIKRAYRKMLLQHHPDKRHGDQGDIKHEYFPCITKAYEVLSDPKMRLAYDSVDPVCDDCLPSISEIEDDFYGSFTRCFNLNARWSERKNVPAFGDQNAKREDVEAFYTFWYDFKSCRNFSYMDEEEKEACEDRWERRQFEKEMKAVRTQRKKKEMLRIRTLVELAYKHDERIQKFKNEDKDKKNAAKRAKAESLQAAKAEQERLLKEAQLEKERAEQLEKQRLEQERIEKERAKKALRRERKNLRDSVKAKNYFASSDKEVLKHMEGLEKICQSCSLKELQELNKQIECQGGQAFLAALGTGEQNIMVQEVEKDQKDDSKSACQETQNKRNVWTTENLDLLTKAVNLFPAGTSQRWSVVATFMNERSTDKLNLGPRDVSNKAKGLQKCDFSNSELKSQANYNAFQRFEESKKEVNTGNDISIKHCEKMIDKPPKSEEPAMESSESELQAQESKVKPCTSFASCSSKSPKLTKSARQIAPSNDWTKEEQALLEQAIGTYPDSTPHRWDHIAACIPNRSKNECIRRVKGVIGNKNSKMESQPQGIDSQMEGSELNSIGTVGETCGSDSKLKDFESLCSHSSKPVASQIWAAEDQALLEQAIKTYPASIPDRWDRVAACIPGKTKKECLRRVKQLMELVQTNKKAPKKHVK